MIARTLFAASFVTACLVGGCSSDDTASPTPEPLMEPDRSPMGGNRPVTPYVPESYRSNVAAPLVILLHGYGVTGALQQIYFGFKPIALEYGFILVAPDGTVDQDGSRFWSATDSCCDFYDTGVDDAAYIEGLIDEAKGRYNIDAKRVYVMGHSNGGYMSYRMACDHADSVAAIASLAGAMYLDPSACKPSEPVAVLQIHGTADDTVQYDGGDKLLDWEAPYPSARQTVESWAALNGCAMEADTSSPPLDLVPEHAGAETQMERYATGCRAHGEVQLWTMQDEPHIPDVGPAFGRAVVEFLLAHPKL